MSKKSHTIVLLQHTGDFATRTWLVFDSVTLAMDGITRMFEHHLKETTGQTTITYDLTQLNAYLDKLRDLSCLVLDERNMSYSPRDKEWIKNKILQNLKQQVDK